MLEQQKNVFSLHTSDNEAAALPMVFDSPHSGERCPDDIGTIAPPDAIRSSCDAFVDELWSGVPRAGGILLAAHFHRAYIDANRAETDIDLELLEQPWPHEVRLSSHSMRGMGLIRRFALPDIPMYERKLTIAEVERRIAEFYLPYRTALKSLLDFSHARYKQVWHVNCHSMKSMGNAMNTDAGSARPDFVVSDCNGNSADPAFTRWVAERLQEMGYQVKINDPYQGGDIIDSCGDPAGRRHSVQIEINRRLYMNEKTFEKNAGFEALKWNLDAFALSLAAYVNARLRNDGIHVVRVNPVIRSGCGV